MKQLLFHKFYPRNFNFSPLLYKIQDFQEKKQYNPLECPIQYNFFTETTAVDTHTLCLTYFDIWGCVFWVLAKMCEVA